MKSVIDENADLQEIVKRSEIEQSMKKTLFEEKLEQSERLRISAESEQRLLEHQLYAFL